MEPITKLSEGKNIKENNKGRGRTSCILVGIFLITYLLIAALGIILVHIDIVESLAKFSLLRAHVMCAGFGMVGATIAAIRKYYSALITESIAKAKGHVMPPLDWGLGWVYYYLSRPILGAILGALSYTLSFVGVLILTHGSDVVISNEGRFLLYALAFVSGFAVSNVLDRLGAVANQIFKVSSNQ